MEIFHTRRYLLESVLVMKSARNGLCHNSEIVGDMMARASHQRHVAVGSGISGPVWSAGIDCMRSLRSFRQSNHC
jgi:hypothetical protein